MFVPDAELNADLCLSSGQVFRFRKLNDEWIGLSGHNIITCSRTEGGWLVSSSPDSSAAAKFFRLNVSAQETNEQILKRAGELTTYINRHIGLRVLHHSPPTETLFSFICSANNNISRITKMVNFLGRTGKSIADDLHAFPSPEVISRLTEASLRSAGFGYRAAIIPKVANILLTQPTNWLESLQNVSYEAAHSALTELPGIGPKVADCICLIGLGHMLAVPVDTHLWNAATELYFPEWHGKPVTPQRYRAVGDLFREKFGDLAGWAHQYLFYDKVLAYRGGKLPKA